MPSTFIVETFHVNIGLGDAAIHVLVKVTGTSKEAVKIVWIDGGTGGPQPMKRFWKTITYIEKRYTNLQGKQLKFDVIVITHWDADHDGGFTKWIENNKKALDYLRFPQATTKIIYPSQSCKLSDDHISDEFLVVNGQKVATVHTGSKLLGQNFFADNLVNKNLGSCDSLTKLLASNNPPPAGQPAMYCVAIDMAVIKYGKQPNESAAIWPDKISESNQASVAAIIAWPSGRVSHYFAGDLDAGREAQIVDWVQPSLGGKRILSLKATHHGSASSNPPMLYEAFRPRNIIVSAADSHNHPG
jgi:hypothetical protein